jgi:hypothetical protein
MRQTNQQNPPPQPDQDQHRQTKINNRSTKCVVNYRVNKPFLLNSIGLANVLVKAIHALLEVSTDSEA